MRWYKACLLLGVGLAGCEFSPNESKSIPKPIHLEGDFSPLKLGNNWKFIYNYSYSSGSGSSVANRLYKDVYSSLRKVRVDSVSFGVNGTEYYIKLEDSLFGRRHISGTFPYYDTTIFQDSIFSVVCKIIESPDSSLSVEDGNDGFIPKLLSSGFNAHFQNSDLFVRDTLNSIEVNVFIAGQNCSGTGRTCVDLIQNIGPGYIYYEYIPFSKYSVRYFAEYKLVEFNGVFIDYK